MRIFTKIKSVFLMLIVLAIFIVCLGCKNEEFEVFLVGCSDSTETISEIPKYPIWDSRVGTFFKDENAPKVKTISFNGKEYIGEYDTSTVYGFNTYQTDEYEFDGGAFGVNSETDELVMFRLYPRKGGTLTAEQCREIAFEFVDQYIDRNKYVMEEKPYTAGYLYSFRKYIGDIETVERLSVSVNKKGMVYEFSSAMLGAFTEKIDEAIPTNEERIQLLTGNAAEKSAKNAFKKIYGNDTQPKIDEQKWVVLEDGTLAIVYSVSAITDTYKHEEYTDIIESSASILVK